MQNSLERLFEGIAVSLRDVVLPEVGDPYARSQLRAAIELLGNLSTRVELRHDQLETLIERIATALTESGITPPDRTDDPLEDRKTFLAALAQWASPDLPDAVKEAMLTDLEEELERLRTGMYK